MLALYGFSARADHRGYVRIYVPAGNALRVYCNSGGWQWLHRLVVSCELGRPLRADEHVHHVDGDVRNCRPCNLELVNAEYHGRLHASAVTLADARGPDGRFRELDAPVGPYAIARRAAVIGPATTRTTPGTPARSPDR